LSFNTGLLDRVGDVPKCISEGLATYAEVRRPNGRAGKVGDMNVLRLDVLIAAQKAAKPWYPVATLLTDEKVLEDTETEQLAYAQSWLLMHYLLNRQPEKLKTYLELIGPRRDTDHRTVDARECFGDLEKLDQELVKYAGVLERRRRK
jgi:hypothetical protein